MSPTMPAFPNAQFPPPAEARRERSRGRARRSRRLGATMLALAAVALAPALALAHPLGNFTINHFAAIRVSTDRVALDVVIDRAEIPAFQEVQRLDTDRNGALAGAELGGQAALACTALVPDLRLAVDGAPVTPRLLAAGLSTPPGAGGLPTLRLVCQLEAALATPLRAGSALTFVDASFAERIGWREIVVLGDGVTVGAAAPDGLGLSNRLTAYPTDLLAQPLDQRSVTTEITPGGPQLPAWIAPDAEPIVATPAGAGPALVSPSGTAAVPGGIGEELAALVDVSDLTPLAVLVSLAVAIGLGAVHALSPGHGKTIMAASLVGGRGSSRQAIGLGLAVAVSHTLGVLVLAALTLAASSVIPPEQLYPILGVVSGGLVVAIGASLLWARIRELAAMRAHADAHEHGRAHPHRQEHGHGATHDEHENAHAHPQPHGHDHPHPHRHDHPQPHGHDHAHPHGHDHSHPRRPGNGSISWRGLVALGLSGGLVPSASALILLLGSIATGRAAYGFVLVLGFGAGMAAVLAGVGLVVVHARRLVERRAWTGSLGRLALPAQLATAALVVALGVVLTGQALTQVL